MSSSRMQHMVALLALSFLTACGGPELPPTPASEEIVQAALGRTLELDPRRVELAQLTVGPPRAEAVAEELVVSGRIVIADGFVDANLDVQRGQSWVTDAVVTLNQRSLPFTPTAHGYFAHLPASEFASSDRFLLEVSSAGQRRSLSLKIPGAILLTAPTQINTNTRFTVSWGAVQGASSIVGDFTTQGGWYGTFEYFSANANRYVYSGVSVPGDATLVLKAMSVEEGVTVQRIERTTIAVVDP